MLTRKCLICTRVFFAKPSWVEKGGGKYCSVKCRALSKRKGEVVKCFNCKKEVYKTLKDLKKSKSKNYFCGKSCQTKWRNKEFSGKKSLLWKNGQATYRDVMLKSSVPRRCVLC